MTEATMEPAASAANPKRRSGRYLDVGERLERQKREVHERKMREWREDLDKYPGDAFCYFAGGEEGLIKIGFSRSPWRRLRDIRRTCIEKISLLAVVGGGQERERYYHTLFAAHRRDGEWFERHPDILAEIERLKS